jgi:hypothetical protein
VRNQLWNDEALPRTRLSRLFSMDFRCLHGASASKTFFCHQLGGATPWRLSPGADRRMAHPGTLSEPPASYRPPDACAPKRAPAFSPAALAPGESPAPILPQSGQRHLPPPRGSTRAARLRRALNIKLQKFLKWQVDKTPFFVPYICGTNFRDPNITPSTPSCLRAFVLEPLEPSSLEPRAHSLLSKRLKCRR